MSRHFVRNFFVRNAANVDNQRSNTGARNRFVQKMRSLQQQTNNEFTSVCSKLFAFSLAAAAVVGVGSLISQRLQRPTVAKCSTSTSTTSTDDDKYWLECAGVVRRDLPTFTAKDVERHQTVEGRLWISYRVGVYDVTEFVSYN